MNKRQKEVLKGQLEAEKAVLEQLEKQYKKALNDINLRIKLYQSDELTQSRIYHIQYQKALKKQVEAALEKLHSDEFSTIQQYLSSCYTDAFVGTMYDIAGQGIPVIAPIDQSAAIKAVMTDSRLNKSLYDELGVDVNDLKKAVSAEITRGIATGQAYEEIARNISFKTNAPLSRANTIVRTESHRIQQASAEDARQLAKDSGADVVKQWDGTLDGKTRDTHRQLDGQIRETHEKFTIGTKEAMYPGDFGDPGEDCNCRCVALTRAKWALDDDELQKLKARAAYFELDKKDSFIEFKNKYLKAAETVKDTASSKAETPTAKGSNKAGVHSVGSINRNRFKAIAADVTTDEVIITDERIAHSNRHLDAYEKYGKHIHSVLSDPDFAFKDKNPNTAVLIKRIEQDGKNLELVLRLHVSTDDPEYKNSILSFWDISETRRKNYERNKEIIYKKE